MNRDYLENIKKKDCIRLDYKKRETAGKMFFEVSKNYNPQLMSGIEYYAFDVPQGWWYIVAPLLRDLGQIGATLHQVKQKMGQLRVYASMKSNETDSLTLREVRNKQLFDLIKEAETRASEICEFCSNGEASKWEIGYICNVCPDCKKALAEYHILGWLYEDSRTTDAPGVKRALEYSKQVLGELEMRNRFEITYE